MNTMLTSVTVLDGLAASLAGLSGIAWHELRVHPGYERNYWREKARTVLETLNNPAPYRHWVPDSPTGWVVSASDVP
jgi:hypothetical protein